MLLINKEYSREFERDADAFAFGLLKRAGSSPIVFANALERLGEEEHGRHAGESWSLRSTHPSLSERIGAAYAAAASVPLDSTPKPAPDPSEEPAASAAGG